MDEARVVRAALTQTKNAYSDMPETVEALPRLADRLDDIRTANLEHHAELIRKSAASGVQVICLGELFAAPYFALKQDPMWRGLAEDSTEGPTVTAMRKVAAEQGVIVIAPIYELSRVNGQCFNTAVVIDETGEILGSYRKTHIPQGENSMGSFDERFYYDASDGGMTNGAANIAKNPFFPVFQTTVGKIGVNICYDRHFPGVMEALNEPGTEMIFSPAVTFGIKSRRMWDLEFPVDAVRHRVFIGGSNRLGAEPPWDVEYFGSSYFVGPEGRRPPIDIGVPELVVADLPMRELYALDSAGWDIPRDVRPPIYHSSND